MNSDLPLTFLTVSITMNNSFVSKMSEESVCCQTERHQFITLSLLSRSSVTASAGGSEAKPMFPPIPPL